MGILGCNLGLGPQVASLGRGAFLFAYPVLSTKEGLRFVAPLTCLGATLEVGEVFWERGQFQEVGVLGLFH